MWILPLLGYAGVAVGLGFLVLAIASGLYYLSELVEEHTVFTRKILTAIIYGAVGIQVALVLFDGLPKLPSALSIGSHLIYSLNLRRFPIVKLADPIFIASCVLVLINHWVWFNHFSTPPPYDPRNYNHYRAAKDAALPSFTEIAAFFGLQVWLVPFAFFVSLSAGENVLPTMGSEYATGSGSSYASPGREPGKPGGRVQTNAGMAKAIVNTIREWIAETGQALGLWKGDKIQPYLHVT